MHVVKHASVCYFTFARDLVPSSKTMVYALYVGADSTTKCDSTMLRAGKAFVGHMADAVGWSRVMDSHVHFFRCEKGQVTTIGMEHVSAPSMQALFAAELGWAAACFRSRTPLPSVTCPWSGMTCALTMRLGRGGSSDVYSGHWPGKGAVTMKLARESSRAVRAHFAAEWKILQLLEKGHEEAAPPCQPIAHRWLAHMGRPAIVFSYPVDGVPLPHALRDCEPGSEPLAKLADAVCRCVLRALRAAHDLGWVHCDVRPQNIVACPGNHFVLVDWGLARPVEAPAHGVGTEVYSAHHVFTQRHVAAHPAMDMESVAHTWVAIALGSPPGVAPWATAKARRRWRKDGGCHILPPKVLEFWDKSSAKVVAPELYTWVS